MKNYLILSLMFCLSQISLKAEQMISLPTNAELTRADIYVEPYLQRAQGTLVLCPGQNGNGQTMIENSVWKEFAQEEHLNLVGISFASTDDDLVHDKGYFLVTHGAGQALLTGLNQAFGAKQPPLLIYGFSGGAHFTHSFVRWKPNLVLTWCSYSAGWWEVPEAAPVGPPGIIACGDDDGYNYGPSLMQFNQGRSMTKPWTWVSIAHTGHEWSTSLEVFVRTYFASVLAHPQSTGLWLDVESKTPVNATDLKEHPTLASWLPDEKVAEAWKQIHQP